LVVPGQEADEFQSIETPKVNVVEQKRYGKPVSSDFEEVWDWIWI